MKNQKGQSLVESLFILPLFALVLGGSLIIFQQALRKIQDDYSAILFSYSDVFFSKEEKKTGQWFDSTVDQHTLLKKITHFLANPSAGFSRSVDTKEGVFLDKQLVYSSNSSPLSALSHFVDSTHLTFETKAGEKGYERSTFFRPGFFASLSNIAHHYEVSSSFLEEAARPLLLWENRPDMCQHAYSEHQHALAFLPAYSFDAHEWAQLSAQYGSTLQESWCYAEAAATCLATSAGALWAGCMAARTANLLHSLASHTPPYTVCPTTIRTITAARSVFEGLAHGKAALQEAQEVSYRAELLEKSP